MVPDTSEPQGELERLKRLGKLPACWKEQRKVLRMPN